MPGWVQQAGLGHLEAQLRFYVDFPLPTANLRRWHQVGTVLGCHQLPARLEALKPICQTVFMLVFWVAVN